LNDAQVRAFMPNVSVFHDPAQEATPRIESARVTLTLDDGTQVEEFLSHVKGSPDYPMERDDVQAKARELMIPLLGAAQVERLIDDVWRLESAPCLDALVASIAR
jgi:2-methylcitrate dehydratase PrpD